MTEKFENTEVGQAEVLENTTENLIEVQEKAEEVTPTLTPEQIKSEVTQSETIKEDIAKTIKLETGETSSMDKESLREAQVDTLNKMLLAIEDKKKGFLNSMIFSEKDLKVAEASIKNQIAFIKAGNTVDMKTIQNFSKFARNVDLSAFDERKNKSYSVGSQGFGGGGGIAA